jgi:hypothetical protein
VDERRDPPAAVAADEVEPACGRGAQAHEKGDERGVVDRERGEGDLRAVAGAEEHAQDRPRRHQRQAEDEKREARDHRLAPRPDEREGGEEDGGEVADDEARRGVGQRHPERARHQPGVLASQSTTSDGAART